jgi:hypothetical protein
MQIAGMPLFVLSHMRSYSSVLSHVLGSHAEIDGYCETHLRYRCALDILRLKWRVRWLTGEPLRGRYVLDKILHDYPMASRLLEGPRTRAIFLLRQPVEAVQSIVHMGTHFDANERNANVASATKYYVNRLRRLTQLARVLGTRAAFVESGTLMTRTDEVLEFLRDFLGLASPLARRYRSFSRTGKPGYGDPSGMIHSGELGMQRRTQLRYSIPSAFVAEAVQAHAECLAACNINCVSLPDRAPRVRSVSLSPVGANY